MKERYYAVAVTLAILAVLVGVVGLSLLIDAHSTSRGEKISRLQDDVEDLQKRVRQLEEDQ